MQFAPTDEYLYWWPINIDRPHATKSGQWEKVSFEMEFVAIPEDDARALAEELAKLEPSEHHRRQHDQLLKAARNWRGVVDNDRKEIPFSADVLTAMLNAAPWYRIGVYDSYARSLIRSEARKGN